MKRRLLYSAGILEAHEYLLNKYPEFFVFGQGLWAPWYVGTTMTDLDIKFGKERVIDSPVSEQAVTGASIGAALNGSKVLVVHPRMDFMLLAVDQIVTQAANWSHMFGGQVSPQVTFRGIINRGGEQGAQHSQAMHAWFAHVPGLRVVMPTTAQDARDLLVASVLCNDPVLYIDDRWLYDQESEVGDIEEIDLRTVKPQLICEGEDITIVSCGHGTKLCKEASDELSRSGFSADVFDLRVLTSINYDEIIKSISRTRRLLAVDGAWSSCGMAGEIIASVAEKIPHNLLISTPRRVTLPSAPAPTSKVLEDIYYLKSSDIVAVVKEMM
jgi:pyruvate/2-oxoglutarate/acetoin dehydrogenase E1 component